MQREEVEIGHKPPMVPLGCDNALRNALARAGSRSSARELFSLVKPDENQFGVVRSERARRSVLEVALLQ